MSDATNHATQTAAVTASADTPTVTAGARCLQLKGGRLPWALPFARVDSVISPRAVHSLPVARRGVLGLVEHAGEAVPLVDLDESLGLAEQEPADHGKAQAVLLRWDDRVVAVLAQKVGAVREGRVWPLERINPQVRQQLPKDPPEALHGFVVGQETMLVPDLGLLEMIACAPVSRPVLDVSPLVGSIPETMRDRLLVMQTNQGAYGLHLPLVQRVSPRSEVSLRSVIEPKEPNLLGWVGRGDQATPVFWPAPGKRRSTEPPKTLVWAGVGPRSWAVACQWVVGIRAVEPRRCLGLSPQWLDRGVSQRLLSGLCLDLQGVEDRACWLLNPSFFLRRALWQTLRRSQPRPTPISPGTG
jgi:chemotaxis signal transduction protein